MEGELKAMEGELIPGVSNPPLVDVRPQPPTSVPNLPSGEESPALQATAVSKTFGRVTVLKDFSIEVARGEVHALVGENGSGKSTFIKILSGYHVPDPGARIAIGGQDLRIGDPGAPHRIGARFVHQDLGLIQSESVLDNLSYGNGYPSRSWTIQTRKARERARVALERVGLDIDPMRTVGSLTYSQRTIVAVARALQSPVEGDGVRLLVLDEPTATLPADEVQNLLEVVRRVARDGVGVIYVTHHLEEVFEVADRITVLRDGHLVAQRATTELDRAQLVNLLVGREFEEAHRESSRLLPSDVEPVLEVTGLTADQIYDLSFEVRPGEVLGFAGITGSGREAVLSAVFGAIPRTSGSVRANGHEVRPGRPDLSVAAGLAYLPRDRKTLGGVMDSSARENFSLTSVGTFWRRIAISRRQERAMASDWFENLDVRPAGALEAKLATFSGGNQQKVLFAKWLWREPPIILFDEPTQGVDIGAKSMLHHHLLEAAKSNVAVVVSSTDIDELAALCTRVVVLRQGRISEELDGERISVRNILAAMMNVSESASAGAA